MQPAPARSLLRRLAPASLLALALSACGGSVLDVQVALITKSCAAAPELDPLAGVAQLKFTVYGEGIDPVKFQTLAPLVQRSVDLPSIPAGNRRRIVVEGIGNDTQKSVISRGEVGPFDIAENATDLNVAIFLRRLDAFSPTATQQAPATCAQLKQSRAAHTATVLEDGRVLIAGGFSVDDQGGVTYLDSTELYDPRTGQVTDGPKMHQARAYHTGTHIPGTSLTLLAGGEADKPGTTLSALLGAEVFDEKLGTMDFRAMLKPRTRHAAAIPPGGGAVLLVGGYNATKFGNQEMGTPQSSTEVFDPKTKTFTLGPSMPSARGELAAIGIGSDKVLVVGGYDGSAVLGQALLFVSRTSGVYDLAQDASYTLQVARAWPSLALLDDGHVVVAGGFSQHDEPFPQKSASSSTEVIDIEGKKTTIGPAMPKRRGHAGAIALNDGSILVAGGGYQDAGGPLSATDTADVLSASSSGHAGLATRPTRSKMQDGRYLARYVLLQDGTVLAVGGVSYPSGKPSALRSLEVFQPNYQSSADGPYR